MIRFKPGVNKITPIAVSKNRQCLQSLGSILILILFFLSLSLNTCGNVFSISTHSINIAIAIDVLTLKNPLTNASLPSIEYK